MNPTGLQPPISEVAFSVQFAEGVNSTILDTGAWYEQFRDRFPNFQQAARIPPIPPLDPIPEVGSAPNMSQRTMVQANIELVAVGASMSLTPRVLLVSSDSHRLLQFQGDRFGFNWRRVAPLDEAVGYPGFVALESEFFDLYEEFANWFVAHAGARVQPTHAELLYANMVPMKVDGVDRRLSEVFKFYKAVGKRTIAGFNANWMEPIKGETSGRIVVNTAVGALPDGALVAIANFTSRVSLNSVQTEPRKWFVGAHAAVLEVFDSTLIFDLPGRSL